MTAARVRASATVKADAGYRPSLGILQDGRRRLGRQLPQGGAAAVLVQVRTLGAR